MEYLFASHAPDAHDHTAETLLSGDYAGELDPAAVDYLQDACERVGE